MVATEPGLPGTGPDAGAARQFADLLDDVIALPGPAAVAQVLILPLRASRRLIFVIQILPPVAHSSRPRRGGSALLCAHPARRSPTCARTGHLPTSRAPRLAPQQPVHSRISGLRVPRRPRAALRTCLSRAAHARPRECAT